MQVPQPYLQPRPQPFYQIVYKTDKNTLMLTITLLGCIALLALSVIYMIFLSKYIIEHKSDSVVSGAMEAMIYIIMLFNLVYSTGIYYVAANEELVYKAMELPIFYASLTYLAIHVVLPLIFLLLMFGNPHYSHLLGFLILPDLIEIIVFGVTAFGFYFLYKKSPFVLVPVQEL